MSALVGAVVATAATAVAATGGTWVLGQDNTATSTTGLTATTSGPALNITNDGTGTGIGVSVPAGKAPLAVNLGAGKALNLNADRVDGLEGSTFVRKGVAAIAAAAAPAGVVDARNTGTGAGVRGLSDHASGVGVRGGNSAGGYAAVFDGKVRVNGATFECPGCTVPNALTVDGRTVGELRPKTLISPPSLTDQCDTPGTWQPCASVALTVPARKTYQVLVMAQASMYEGAAYNRVLWCASVRPASTSTVDCAGEARGVTVGVHEMTSITAVTSTTLGPGDYVLSGAIHTANALDYDASFDYGIAQTHALVVDVT